MDYVVETPEKLVILEKVEPSCLVIYSEMHV